MDGFYQQPDLDYSETFSLVVKYTTICIIAALATSKYWLVRQLDIQQIPFSMVT